MPEHELEKLLGGFAADTLTPEEKQQLYRAALHDQQLFTALADEQALKELLADPVVRQKLLRTLREASAATHSSASWLDWLRRPAGVAWAGGLTTAAIAVVLGVRIYQDSLQQASRSVAAEEARPVAPSAAVPSTSQPTTPPINEPEFRTNKDVDAPVASPRKETLARKVAKRESVAAPNTQQSREAGQPEKDALPKRAEPTTDTFTHAKAEPQPATDQTTATSLKPLSPTSLPERAQTTAGATTPSQTASSPSARFLFYGGALHSDARLMAEEKERSEKPLAESNRPSSRMELKKQRFADGKTTRPGTSIQPLGIRYSIQIDGTADQSHERTAGFTNRAKQVTLTIESNQDGYLQVWEQAEALPPHLLFPVDHHGQISSRLAAHERIDLSFQAILGTLVIRCSRVAANGVERGILDHSSQNQLRESVPRMGEDDSQEQATYVVNQDPSLSEIVVRIPIPQP